MLKNYLILIFCLSLFSPLYGQIYPCTSWIKKTPGEVGVDSVKFKEALAALNGMDTSKMAFIRGGYMFHASSKVGTMQSTWSVTKSFTSTVLGLLIDEGKLAPHSKVSTQNPSMKKYYPDVTYEHFASHTSGYKANGNDVAKPFTPVAPGSKPGAKFFYDDVAMNQFGNLLTAAGKRSMS